MGTAGKISLYFIAATVVLTGLCGRVSEVRQESQ